MRGIFILKLNKIILVSIFILVLIGLGVVTAQDNSTCEIGCKENFTDLSQVCEVGEDMQTDVDDKLHASSEDVVGDITADNVTVNVSNVFVGQNATISVSVPESTGTVNITVGEKVYTPELISGVACQTISEYNIGLNNVTIKYDGIVKETSFKVLDGIITSETFNDYFAFNDSSEYERYYYLRSFIPEASTLDFRGHIAPNLLIRNFKIYINKPHNITSTNGEGFIEFYLYIQSDAINSNVSNIKIMYLYNEAPNLNVVNLTAPVFYNRINDLRIENSIIGDLDIFSNSTVINCTVDKNMYLRHSGMSNVKLINSTFNNGVYMYAEYMWLNPVRDIIIKNCIISGQTIFIHVIDALIEDCTFNDGNVDLLVENLIFNNNYVNVPSSTYAINLQGPLTRECEFTNNRIYSKWYCGNNAIVYQYKFDVNFWPQTNNIFKNNTPTQTDLNIGFTANPIFYDENTTVVVNMPGIEGNVAFYFNGEKISTVKLVDGIATLTIDKYELGINNVSAIYEDLVDDIWGINHASFNVNKNPCLINIICDSEIGEKMFTVNVVLPDDANGDLTLVLSNAAQKITIKQYANGTYNMFLIPALLEGNYTISATFSSIKYLANTSAVNVMVIHIPVYKLTANDIVMDYKDGSKYKVLVTKDGKAVGSGEVVKITFNGKTKYVKTDNEGYAILTLDGAPKTYTIKAEYNGITKSSKVTIKNVLKAKNISKKKVKKVKFSATLKTSKGKAIKGKKITFKLKGGTYSAKTNKKGVATIYLKI